ncbi:LamG-like jellyroll fold domain-containing protein [Streptacidiphilus sp. EB103A]|uniref:LamG-like jellyroll fold domain-containing protein n=1 Tax=Streptacidiphilus sp. EB103A TaxID=3156275 RepID=UPI0035112EAC
MRALIRLVAVVMVAVVAWGSGITTAGAAETGFPSLHIPSLSQMLGWLSDPHWGRLPQQQTGTAAGHSHRASAAATRSGRGAGHKPGSGKGQLPVYAPYQSQPASGVSASQHGYDARTSRRNAVKSTRTSNYFQNADGSITRHIAQAPINYKDANGNWQPIDTRLTAGGGRWHESGNSVAVDFAANGTDPQVATVGVDAAHSVSFGLSGASSAMGRVAGSTIDYPAIAPGTDLLLTPTATGAKEAIVLRSAQAGNSWTFPLGLKGLTPRQLSDGSIDLVDAAGRTVEQIPHAYAYDSKVDPRSGDSATTSAVSYQLVHTGGQWALKVTLDARWLHDSARQFPVTVDPTVTDGWTTAYSETGNTGDHSYEQFVKIGSYDSGTTKANAYINHWDTSWDGSGVTVTAATLNLFDTWASTCTAERFDVALVTQAWTPSGVSAYPGPTYGASIGNATPTVSAACANTGNSPSTGNWVSVALSTSAFQGWMSGATPDYGLAVYGATTDALHWKKFASFMDPNLGPYMSVTYTGNTGPQIYEQYPNNNAVAYTTTPELTAWSSGANSTGSSSTLKYDFSVYDNTNTKVADSGQIAAGDWTVPAGKLTWGHTYYWQVLSYDSSIWSASTGLRALSVQVPQPLITSGLSQNSSEHGFDSSIGNYTTSDTDATVSTAGPSLDVVRDYNSRDPRYKGAFGAGWSSVFDSRATEQYDASGAVTSVLVTYPDGSQVGFGRNGDGTFSPPSGRWATFKSVTGGYTLTDKNDTVYTFTTSLGSGGYGISSITDATGNPITYHWTGSQIDTMTSGVSGRALHLTWSTPTGAVASHVATVATDPVDSSNSSSALTWTYIYTGDQLTSMCTPLQTAAGSSGACAKYAYTAGSQYQNAVLDLGASSYWPLSDASGTTATDKVLANQGDKNATYSGVTLGQSGNPLTGSSATVASFNGTSSQVQLPDNTGNNANSGALSMWFKTSTKGGVLYSYASTPVSAGSTTGYYTPSIYVGSTDGKLNAEFWYSGGVAPLVSSASVADGNWHHIVLSAAGNSQTLFLDDAKVGSLSGTVTIKSASAFGQNQPYNVVGAGFLGGTWPDEPNYSTSSNTGTASYFNGSIANVAWYDRPLVAADVDALYQYAHHAGSLLSQVTRPSGKVYSQVQYDPATTTVTQVTDENGGVWKLNAPTITGSSQTYRGAVLGGAPVDYWRLGDAAGSTSAVNEVRGGVATYNAVTLGQGGPFSDITAGKFNGTSSYLQLPSSATVSGGANSVEMWFTMNSGSTAGGVLFDYAGASLTGGSPASNSYVPALYVGTDGLLRGRFWGFGYATTTAKVNDGKWHHVMLSTSTTAETLYLDGTQAATATGTATASNSQYVYVGAGEVSGWPSAPTNTLGYFPGSIAEVSLNRAQLSAQDDAVHYAAGKNSTGLLPVENVTVTDPTGATETNRFDVANGYRQLSETDGLGNTTSFGYDTSGFQYAVVNPNGVATLTGHDVRGNVVSTTTCQNEAANACSTQYFTYYPDDTTAQLTTADPRNDTMLTSRDGRSASATDTTYLTSFGYDSSGNRTTVTTPAVPGFPNGRTTTTVYSDGTSTYPASDSGNVPKGLPVSTTTPGGAVNKVAYNHLGDVTSTTDADGLVTTFSYDNTGRVKSKTQVSDTYPNGLTTSYSYDADGQVTQETDPAVTDRVSGAIHTAQTSTVFDVDGGITAQTVADTTGGDATRKETTAYNSYDQVASRTDGNGNAGATNGATTSYSYDAMGEQVKETTQSGVTTESAYDADGHLLTVTLDNYTDDPVNPSTATNLVESSRAYDPAGRLASITDSMGNTTTYTYTDNGFVSTITRTDKSSHSYQVQSNTFDDAGNLTQRVTDNGATVSQFKVDAASRVTTTTLDPTGADRVTQRSYTPDDQAATTTQTDATGYDRTTSASYDPMGNVLSQTVYGDASGHPSAWYPLNQTSGTAVTDASGNGYTATADSGVTWSGGAAAFAGSTTGTGGLISANAPVLTTNSSYTVSAWVDPADLSTYRTFVGQAGANAGAFYLQYNKAAGGWTFVTTSADSTTGTQTSAHTTSATANTWTHLVGVYNSSTGAMSLYVNGALAASATAATTWNASGPLTVGGVKTTGGTISNVVNGQVSDVQAYPRALSAAEVATLYGNGRTGGTVGSNNSLTTSWSYDKRGLPTAKTDPNQNTTAFSYDEGGNLALTTAPAVAVEGVGTERPFTGIGYDTFGEPVEQSDADGNVTRTGYDANGQKISQTLPSYTPTGASSPVNGTTTWTYDSDGNVVATQTPGGETTQHVYDQLGDVAKTIEPDSTTLHSTYDTNGEELSSSDGNGATTQATYDWMGRRITSTVLERYPTAQTLTSQYSYGVSTGNPYGAFLASTTTPGNETTSYGYDRLGETTRVTDAAGNATNYSYDFAGRLAKTTLADNSSTQTAYNPLGLPTDQWQYDTSGNQLTHASTTYDGNGNATAVTDANQHTSHFVYDASNLVTQETQPVDANTSITTSFGYDAAGNRVRFTDGRNNNWTYGFTPWGQQASVTAPPVTTSGYSYTTAADSTTTYAYTPDGQLQTMVQPGGVTSSYAYDSVGNVTTETGTGADAATATRNFTYDNAGKVLTAATSTAGTSGNPDHQAATSNSFSYNDRGQLLTASGSGGSSSFGYNNDGNLITRADAAGTTSYGYDTAGRLSTLNDAATGTQLSYGYNTLNQPQTVTYGSSGNVRTYGYDTLHRLKTDTLAKGATTLASINYGYDNNGNLLTKNTTGVGGASNNTYTYDWANRLTSWNNGSTNTAYAYDASGNRTQVGSNVYTYDARDQLTSDGVNTYRYSARGTLTLDITSSGSTAYAADAYGQQITAGTQSYTLDAGGRNISDTDSANSTSRTFQYSGAGNTIAGDGDYTYTYGPGDALIGMNTAGATSTSTGVLAVTDQHADVVGTFAAGGTALSGSATYDPLGNVTGGSALPGHLGFQSGWTEQATGKVGTASRWYNPATGTFLNKDSASLNPVPNSVSANPFAYVNDNPLAGTDQSGQCSWYDVVCGVSEAASTVSSAVDDFSSWSSNTFDSWGSGISSWASDTWNTVVSAAATVVHVVTHPVDSWHHFTHWAHRVYHWASRHVRRWVRSAVHAWHAIKRAAKAFIRHPLRAIGRGISIGIHATVRALKATGRFIKHHAAAITSFVASTAVFAGCEAFTAGIGSVGCAAAAGAVGNLVTQGFKCADKGGSSCSLGAFGKTALEGAAEGALGGGLGELGGAILGKVAPKALDAVGGLFGKGATEATDTATTDATDQAAREADANQATSSTDEAGGSGRSCPTPHSFTGATPVLMADGTARAIDRIKVGDTIANAVPGQKGTQAHKVTAVIVTHTDHDFADVTISPVGRTADSPKAQPRAANLSVKSRIIRKTGLGLAAAAAGIGALLGLGHHDPSAATSATPAAYTLPTDGTTATGGTLHTTFHHPFYDETQSSFVEAEHLHPGDLLQTPTGTAQVTDVHLFHANTTTYDLTIGDLHTYYVLAGTTPVLVHNCGSNTGGTYGSLKPANQPGLPPQEINHMPQNASTPLGYDRGPAIRMDKVDHRQVWSTGQGSRPEPKAWLMMQRELVNSGRIDEAMQNDINDITTRFPGKYNNAIGDMIGALPGNAQYQALRTVPKQVQVQLTLW